MIQGRRHQGFVGSSARQRNPPKRVRIRAKISIRSHAFLHGQGRGLLRKRIKKAARQQKEISADIFAEISALVNTTLSEGLVGYTSGAMQWCQRFQPDLVNGLATIETYVNDLSQAGDVEGVKEALSRYRAQVETMVRTFRAESARTGSLF